MNKCDTQAKHQRLHYGCKRIAFLFAVSTLTNSCNYYEYWQLFVELKAAAFWSITSPTAMQHVYMFRCR